jgi:hypothetical protein
MKDRKRPLHEVDAEKQRLEQINKNRENLTFDKTKLE